MRVTFDRGVSDGRLRLRLFFGPSIGGIDYWNDYFC